MSVITYWLFTKGRRMRSCPELKMEDDSFVDGEVRCYGFVSWLYYVTFYIQLSHTVYIVYRYGLMF